MLRSHPKKILVDTDAGFDDLVALTCLLAHGYDIDLVTTVCGSNTALDTHHALQRLFSAGLENRIVPSKNRSRPSQAWLTDFRRRFDGFVERHGSSTSVQPLGPIPSDDDDMTTGRVRRFLLNSPDDSVDLLCLGPLSNVASWMEQFPDLMMAKVANVWILGGSHPTTGRVDEFNFGQDTHAASFVLEGRLAKKITLIPGDATSHNLVADDFIPTVVDAARRQSQLQVISNDSNRNKLNPFLLAQIIEEEQQYSIFYDPICVFLYLHPEAARFSPVPLRVDPESGVTKYFASAAAMIPIAEQVDFGAYQVWLLQAIHATRNAPGASCTTVEEARPSP